MLLYNRNLKEASRQLRKNVTEAERLFWSGVRGKQLSGAQFYRQKIVGDYIVDFYCPQARLVVEIDGGGSTTRNKERRRTWSGIVACVQKGSRY